MFEILTKEQSRLTDRHAIESGIAGFQLMQAAGTAVAHIVMQRMEKVPVVVLCGKGNNGGDGFVAAKVLRDHGWPVRVACALRPEQLAGDIDVLPLNSNLSLRETGLVVDAVFGTGFSGDLAAELVTLFDKIRTKNIPVVAIDLPSGLDADTGNVAEGTLAAHITITFTRKKPAHVLYPARGACGAIHVAHIGVPDESVAMAAGTLFENAPALWVGGFPLPDAQMHKYDRGHVAVVAGDVRTGAGCLSAMAAQRMGAGAVTLVATPAAAAACRVCRSSVMTEVWETLPDFKACLRDVRKNVLVIGPGLGTGAAELALAEAALGFGRAAVLDADIFTLYAATPDALFEQLSPERHVLTPHAGEFQRLFPDIAGENKPARAIAAAKRAGAVVMLKGADTVIAAPDGTCIVNTNAPATLATAGSGDVLSGMVAGLMAQGMHPFMAAAAACHLHADSARRYGMGLIPEDIVNTLPAALNGLFRLPASP